MQRTPANIREATKCYNDTRHWTEEMPPFKLGRLSIARKPRERSEYYTYKNEEVPDDVEAKRTYHCIASVIRLTLMQGHDGEPCYVLVTHGAPTVTLAVGQVVVRIDDKVGEPIAEFMYQVYATAGQELSASVRAAWGCTITLTEEDYEKIVQGPVPD